MKTLSLISTKIKEGDPRTNEEISNDQVASRRTEKRSLICMKRLKKNWKHLKDEHNLEDECRSFLNSYYLTRNAKSVVYQCTSCLLRVANDRLYRKKIPDCQHKLTKIKESNSVKIFPAIVQKDFCTSKSRTTKAALDAGR